MSQEQRNTRLIDMDAWSNGQMRSKLWLCQALEEKYAQSAPLTVAVYGSWYGTLPFLLLSRERLKIRELFLFDLDAEAVEISKQMLKVWWLNNILPIHFEVRDCNEIKWEPNHQLDLLINTSCEHFASNDWYFHLPKGTQFALQATDMPHPTHINSSPNLTDFKNQFGTDAKIDFESSINFSYPHLSFNRFMILGQT